jgi:hypothetical protein
MGRYLWELMRRRRRASDSDRYSPIRSPAVGLPIRIGRSSTSWRRALLAARPAAHLCFDREQVGRSAELLHHQAPVEPPHQRRHPGLCAIRRYHAGSALTCLEEAAYCFKTQSYRQSAAWLSDARTYTRRKRRRRADGPAASSSRRAGFATFGDRDLIPSRARSCPV